MLSLLLGVLLVIAVVFLRIVCKLRLVVPLLLAIAFQTILRPWYQAHIAFGTAFFLLTLLIIAFSWLITLRGIVLDAIEERTANRIAVERFIERVRLARANGETAVNTDGLW